MELIMGKGSDPWSDPRCRCLRQVCEHDGMFRTIGGRRWVPAEDNETRREDATKM